jgi:alpha-D-ribose 1-methylphosphonate 5-triphosphate synthase subunit PhnL
MAEVDDNLDCPSDDEIDAFVLARLELEPSLCLLAHLQHCGRCQQRVTLTRDFISALSIAISEPAVKLPATTDVASRERRKLQA